MNIGDSVMIPCHISPTGKQRPWNRTSPPPANTPLFHGIITSISPWMVRVTDPNAHPAVLGVDQMVEPTCLQNVPAQPASAAPVATTAGHMVWGVPRVGSKPYVPATPPYTGPKALKPVYSATTDPKCCVTCRTFNEYAEPNQPDGKYKCYSCRKDPTRFML